MPNSTSTEVAPQTAQYFDLVNKTLEFTNEELGGLVNNGFVVTDRLVFEQFKRAYAWIYWKDLPVLVTTDSILHAIHQTYDQMFQQVEMTILTQKLVELLSTTRQYLTERRQQENDPRLDSIYADLDLFLTIPRALLSPVHYALSERAQRYLAHIRNINDEWYHSEQEPLILDGEDEGKELRFDPVGIERVTLFGLTREIDLTLFQARGHYDKPEELVAYFGAMMWLGLLDFRFVEYDTKTGEPILHREQLVAAHLLRDAIDAANQRPNWVEINELLTAFVGWSDNITLNGLDAFIEDAGIKSPLDYFTADEGQLVRLLVETDYGHQRIRGEFQRINPDKPPMDPAVSFALMGQRFTVESFAMQQLVYDQLMVGGKRVERAYPSPLDVMYVLGSERALVHLADELARYGYQNNLHELRQQINTYSEEFWQSSFYNLWLKAICGLNDDTRSPQFPQAMRSDAWQDKTLHTQLASWAQLRHDNILYVKPPYSPPFVCEYPAGYVEPYPNLYAALRRYADFGYELFSHITLPQPKQSLEEAKARKDVDWRERIASLRPHHAAELRDKMLTYFQKLAAVMANLEGLSHKELKQESFSEEDNLFLRSIVIRKYVGDTSYGGRWGEEHWDGWYNDLLPFGDDNPQLVADVHTNYNDKIGTPGVLHVGTGEVAAIAMIVDAQSQPTLYVGPAFTYYEHLEAGLPPRRLKDEEWYGKSSPSDLTITRIRNRMEKASAPSLIQMGNALAEAQAAYGEALAGKPKPPTWTESFFVRDDRKRRLVLSDALEHLKEGMSARLLYNFDYILYKLDLDNGMGTNLKSLPDILYDDPQRLLSIEGVDEAMLEELKEILNVKGYLRKGKPS